MGCLPWILGALVLFVGSAIAGGESAGWVWLVAIATLLFTYYIIDRYKKYKEHESRRNEEVTRSSPQRSPPTPHPPSPIPIVFTPVKIEEKGDFEGIHDAYTGETLDERRGVYQCQACKAYYHSDTITFLRKENHSRCINYSRCFGTTFIPIAKATKGTSEFVFFPQAISLINYQQNIGRVVTFEGLVKRIDFSRTGRSLAIMFENKAWSKGLKAVVLSRYIDDAGGVDFLTSLRGRIIKVRGLLEEHTRYGPQILITRKSMIVV